MISAAAAPSASGLNPFPSVQPSHSAGAAYSSTPNVGTPEGSGEEKAREADDETLIDLEEGTEWRFELEDGEAVGMKVVSDQPVYINSQWIPPNTWYPLYGELRSAIWAPYGGRLELSHPVANSYHSTSTTFPKIHNLHLALEYRRILAKRDPNAARPHRIMVMGPAHSGKSTLVKNLVNLAVGNGLGWSPGVVSLDPGDSPHLVPGSLTLSCPNQPLPSHHPIHYLGSPPTTAPAMTLASDVLPLAWYLGTNDLGRGTCFPLFKNIVAQMASAYETRCKKDNMARLSGLFIDTPSSIISPSLGAAKGDKTRYGLINEVVEAFGVDLILVIGAEKLTIEMKKLFEGKGVTVLSFEKSSGAVDLDESYKSRLRSRQAKAYFYGEPQLPESLKNLDGQMVAMEGPLHPQNFTVSWDDLQIYRIGEESDAPSSALPIGKQATLSPTKLTVVDPSRLQNAVLGLVPVTESDAISKQGEGKAKAEEEEEDEEDDTEAPWKEEIGWRELAGIVVITRVDVAKKRFELLTPSPGRLPSKVAIAGNVEWNEEEA